MFLKIYKAIKEWLKYIQTPEREAERKKYAEQYWHGSE
jgi:hypothetical protein